MLLLSLFQILNLFLALLLSSFASESMEARARKKKRKASVMHRMKKVLLAIRFASRLRRKRVAPKTEVEAGENQLNDNEGEENPDQVQEAETNGKVQGKRA